MVDPDNRSYICGPQPKLYSQLGKKQETNPIELLDLKLDDWSYNYGPQPQAVFFIWKKL